VDCIDLYQVHEPSLSVPLEETMGALEDLVAAGKVRFLGVSNFSVPQLERAQRALRKNRLAANQVRYNLADRTIEQGLLAYCQAQRITVIAYSPLARRFSDLVDCDPTGALAEVARVTGKTPAQIAINWCLCQEGVVAIPKGNSVAHVLENCGASDWRLSAEQRQLLAARVRFRRRSGLETLLRRLLPRGAKQALQRAVRALPAGMRRGLN
jgi:diketogulonate reductase-like aldo/keto reductase